MQEYPAGKSTNSGGNWSAINTGGLAGVTVRTLAIDSTDPDTLYAGTDGGSVFKSTNSGGNWGAASFLTGSYVRALAIDPADASTLYAGTNGGVFKSTNGGGVWIPVNSSVSHQYIGALTIDKRIPSTLYAGTDGGVYKSSNGGDTWSLANRGINAIYVYALAIDPANPNIIYPGTYSGIFKSTNGSGGAWDAVNIGLINHFVKALAIDPVVPSTLYAGTYGGVFKSMNGGAAWGAVNTGLTNTSVVALAIDPVVPSILYAGTSGGGVFKSTNGGGAWEAVNIGLTNTNVYTLAIDPVVPSILYAGTSGGGVFKSTTGGGAWESVNTGLISHFVKALAIDPTNPSTLYAGTSGGGVFKSMTGGAAWESINIGLTNTGINTLAIDPTPPSTLYAGTDGGGVFAISFTPILDLSVDSVLPIQVLEGQSLVKDKATAIKAVIRKTGNEAVNKVSARLAYGSSTFTNFYVAEPSNSDAQNALIADNTTYPLNFASSETTKTIYFFNDNLAPIGNTFQASVTVDYLGIIPETDETNNIRTSDSVTVSDTRWSGLLFPDLYIHYFRTDWGFTPTTTFDNYYNTSNDFLKGVYPVAGQRFQPNKSSNYIGNTATFRQGDGKLDSTELGRWIMSTLPQMQIAHPTADRFIATVPSGWFASTTTGGSLPQYVGVAYPAMRELVVAEAGTTNRPNGPSIVAHEVGHSYTLNLGCEEYNNCNITIQDGIGNYASSGLWVDKRIPVQPSADRKIYCFMGSYKDREYWIDSYDYSALMNDHKTTALNSARSNNATTQAILAVGTFHNDGTATLDNWYVLPEAELSALVPGPYTFEYQDGSEGVLYQQSFDISFDLMGTALTESPFVFTIPYVEGTSKIIVKYNNVSEAEKPISPNKPIVTIVSPNGGELIGGQTTIQWSGSDLDGDSLSYMILFSTDNGTTWNPIESNVTTTGYQWSVSDLLVGTQYLIKVVATDGITEPLIIW